jgi:hypothetical protein
LLPAWLQNGASKINQAVLHLPCKLRLLLTGTPIQNDLSGEAPQLHKWRGIVREPSCHPRHNQSGLNGRQGR